MTVTISDQILEMFLKNGCQFKFKLKKNPVLQAARRPFQMQLNQKAKSTHEVCTGWFVGASFQV